MFPYQQMAIGLTPQYYGGWCRICSATCCDTGSSIICFAAYSGGGGGCAPFSCDLGRSNVTVTQVQVVQAQPGDPVEQLQALRKSLEVALAGAEAQEQALRKQREGGTDQEK
jgi:hypothetical protein